MFGWLRMLWNLGGIPPKPSESYLDWPDEERWEFDYVYWMWVPVDKLYDYSDYDDGDEDDDEDEDEDEDEDDAVTNHDDDTVLDEAPCQKGDVVNGQVCEGGECRLPVVPVEFPQETHVCCGGACQMPVKDPQ